MLNHAALFSLPGIPRSGIPYFANSHPDETSANRGPMLRDVSVFSLPGKHIRHANFRYPDFRSLFAPQMTRISRYHSMAEACCKMQRYSAYQVFSTLRSPSFH
jgi:hypothetical protein